MLVLVGPVAAGSTVGSEVAASCMDCVLFAADRMPASPYLKSPESSASWGDLDARLQKAEEAGNIERQAAEEPWKTDEEDTALVVQMPELRGLRVMTASQEASVPSRLPMCGGTPGEK